jgi:hypothetical protein
MNEEDSWEIACRYCPTRYPLFFRRMNGEQRSGYSLMVAHLDKEHYEQERTRLQEEQQARGAAWPAIKYSRVARLGADHRCPVCDGRGCEACEPNGPVVFNMNTLERQPDREGRG